MPVSAFVASATHPESPVSNTWVSLSLTFQGLKALGVRQDSLDSFPVEFQQGMAARAKVLGDTGENSPENWEKPLGTPEVHVVITAISPNQVHLASALERARQAYKQLPGITAIWRQDVHVMPGEKEPFGFRDGISHPAIEGSGIPGTNPNEQPIKAGDFILGYPDEMGTQTTRCTRKFWAATAAMLRSANCTSGWRSSANISSPSPLAARKKS